jgi:hypothetical protein
MKVFSQMFPESERTPHNLQRDESNDLQLNSNAVSLDFHPTLVP